MSCAILLLDAGSFVNHSDWTGATGLHNLLRNNNERLSHEELALFTDILLQYGALPNKKAADGKTPLFIANMFHQQKVLDVIYMSYGRYLLTYKMNL